MFMLHHNAHVFVLCLFSAWCDTDLIMCRKLPGIAIGRLCVNCDGKCCICDSYVRPCTLVSIYLLSILRTYLEANFFFTFCTCNYPLRASEATPMPSRVFALFLLLLQIGPRMWLMWLWIIPGMQNTRLPRDFFVLPFTVNSLLFSARF